MMMCVSLRAIFLIFFFSSGIYIVSGQQAVHGVLLEQGSSIRLAGVDIMNINTGARVISNDLGLFTIQANLADTLIFRKPSYLEREIILTSLSDLIIGMQRQIELSQVTVLGQTKKQELDEVRSLYRKKGTFYGGKPPLLSYIFTPLTALYELIGKTPNQARRFNAYYSRELQESEIDRRFNFTIVQALTGLEGNDLKNFMFLYRPGYDAVSKMDDYELILFIRKSLANFDSTGRPKGLLSLPKLPKAPDLSEKIKF